MRPASSNFVCRISGVSEILGVTRYQWPSTMAAIDPPVTKLSTDSWTRKGTASADVGAQLSAT